MIRCEHCDVDAYYNMSIEDFNDSESVCNSLCMKCVKIEMRKIIDSFPAIKSLMVEPIIHPLLKSRLGIDAVATIRPVV